MRTSAPVQGKRTCLRSHKQLVAKLGLEHTAQGPFFGTTYTVGSTRAAFPGALAGRCPQSGVLVGLPTLFLSSGGILGFSVTAPGFGCSLRKESEEGRRFQWLVPG